MIGITRHQVREGDARDLSFIASESVHLVCTSPPYGDLKDYPEHPSQLGNIAAYEQFLAELDAVWAECFRILVPGGRVACVVGDICISRKRGGRHHVLPLSADLQLRARRFGFDCLTPIRWLKVSNIKMECSRSSRFLGKPIFPTASSRTTSSTFFFFASRGDIGNPHRKWKNGHSLRPMTMRGGFRLFGLT
jgi:DNA modification methylase